MIHMTYAIDITSSIAVAWITGMSLRKIWGSYLNWRNKNFVISHEKTAFEEVASLHPCTSNFLTSGKIADSLEYERTCDAFSAFHGSVSRMLSVGIVVFGAIPLLFSILNGWLGLPLIVTFTLSVFLTSLVADIISIPFSLYSNFTLEEKFGFNMMTKKTFWTDFCKEEIVSCIMTAVMFSLLYAAVTCIHAIYGKIDMTAAVALAAVMSVGSLLNEIVQIDVLTPLFNKLTPLENSELKTRAERLLRDFGYDPSGVFVMDASKRTKHSNAYCTGWGKSKKLVLFDTLLKNFSDDEVIAILGHELAHAKLKHLIVWRVIDFVKTFAMIALSSMLMYSPMLYDAFGWRMVDSSNAAEFAVIGLFLAEMLISSWSWVFAGAESYVSRLMEFAADKHSCIFTKMRDPMITALFKLYGENLSFPLSDKLYESWHFSHPGLVNRVKAICKISKGSEK